MFEAPWESRLFGMAAAYLEGTGQSWEPLRTRLMAAIAAAPDGTPYYESLATAFESLLVADGIVSKAEIERLR